VTVQEFYHFVADYLALIFMIIMMFSLYNAASTFGLEKESKIREALRMQGVSNGTLVSSWFLSLGLQYFVMALAMAFASRVSLFQHAEFGLMLFGYWMSLLAFMAFALVVHTLFDSAKTSGMCSVVFFVAGYPIWRTIQSGGVSPALRFLGQLHPGAGCCFLIQSLALFEGNGQGVTWTTMFTTLNGSSFGESLGMLLLDTFLLSCLGFYLELVLPKEFGRRLGPCFCCARARPPVGLAEAELVGGAAFVVDPLPAVDTYEEHSSAERNLEMKGKCIAVRSLTKQFETPDGIITACENLSFTMLEGQIFALLGHNGAGKTSCINILSGLYVATAGDAIVRVHPPYTDTALAGKFA
jgi:ABC-type multidrug transport system fused ATPase/permease subunit